MSQKYASEKLVFKKCNLEETEIQESQFFDVGWCIFTLHWMNKLEEALQSVTKTLMPGGIFMAIYCVDNVNLVKQRRAFQKNSQWKECFDDKKFQILPFVTSEDDYQ